MTEKELNAFLYSQTTLHLDDYIIDAWFNDSTGEKHVDVINKLTRKETAIIVNDMAVDQLRKKFIEIICVC